MDKNICYNCFKQKSENEAVCSFCGYDSTKSSKYPHALKAGTVLGGKYILGRVLGQGGFGITYIAQDYQSKELVAIKEYFPEAMATRSNTTVSTFSGQYTENFEYGKQCFLEEAKTLAEFIGNPNIVRVYSFFEENGTAYFAMEYVQGTSLKEYLDKNGGKISYEEAKWILLPVMDALASVHAKGIIHRDISPDNIFITENSGVKLIDFGAARYSIGDKSRSLDVILKHGYAPKEQYTRRGRQGAYTDVYALAATFYRAITGRIPPDSIDRMDEDDLVEPSVCGLNISLEAEEALLKALSVQPIDRFQTMGEFKDALIQGDIAAEDRKRVIEEHRKLHEQKAKETPVLDEKQKTEELKLQAVQVDQKPIESVERITTVSLSDELLEERVSKQDNVSELVIAAAQNSEIKKKNRKKIVLLISSVALLVVIVFSIIFIVKALDPQRTRTFGDYEYHLSEDRDSVCIDSYLGDDSVVIVPETIKGKYVWRIDDGAFSFNENITEVEISGCRYIGESAFMGCIRLGTVTIADGTETISSRAFSSCKWLAEVYLPKTLTKIYADAFEDSHIIRDIYFDGTEDSWSDIDGSDKILKYLPEDVVIHFLGSNTTSADSDSDDYDSDVSGSEKTDASSVDLTLGLYGPDNQSEELKSISKDDFFIMFAVITAKANSVDELKNFSCEYAFTDTDGKTKIGELSFENATDSESSATIQITEIGSKSGKIKFELKDSTGKVLLEKSVDVYAESVKSDSKDSKEKENVPTGNININGEDVSVKGINGDFVLRIGFHSTNHPFSPIDTVKANGKVMIMYQLEADSLEELKDLAFKFRLTNVHGNKWLEEWSFESATEKELAKRFVFGEASDETIGSKEGKLKMELIDKYGNVFYTKSIDVVE